MPKKPLLIVFAALLITITVLPFSAQAFCGFYVAKADAKLFNKASKIVVTRSGQETVLTMANDYQGDLKEFAIVFPVPVVLEKEQVRIADIENIEHLDRYSAPRLVEYQDRDPCAPPVKYDSFDSFSGFDDFGGLGGADLPDLKIHGVKIEASYQVGEYDILVLSGEQSTGLLEWLNLNGYRVPEAAKPIITSYVRQKMKFFVAKVNLKAQAKMGASYLRPLQVRYSSKKFMVPIRLGTANASGDQELLAYFLTENGRVECTNYKTTKMPTGDLIPTYVKDEFGEFYKKVFDKSSRDHRGQLLLEYNWGMVSCDPCADDPLSEAQLIDLGCHWLEGQEIKPFSGDHSYITRMHVRYNAETFPEDLQFQLTGDKSTFQCRYVLNVPFRVNKKCDALEPYFKKVKTRWNTEVANLVELTGEAEVEIWKKQNWPYVTTAYDRRLYGTILKIKLP